LLVAGPRYAGFFIRATIVVDAGRDPDAIRTDIERALSKRLALITRRPGVAVTRRDVAAWLRGIDGVERIAELRLVLSAGREVDEIAVPRGGLPRFDLSRSVLAVKRSTP